MQKWDSKGKYLLVHSNDTFQSLWLNPYVGRLMFKRNINHTITVDACHTCYKNLRIVVAVMQDGNGKLQFIAAGICSGETTINYTAFLKRLKYFVVKKRRVTILSDRAPSITAAVRDVFGEQAQHVCCWKHLERNVYSWTSTMERKDVDKLLLYIRKMAKTGTVKEFEQYQKLLKKEYNSIYEKLNGVTHIWARIQLQDHIYGVLTSNAAEIINGLLMRPINFGESARDSHAVVMTVGIYNLMRSQIEKRREVVDDFLSRNNGQLKRVSDYVVKKINAYNNSSMIDQIEVIDGVVYHKERLSNQAYYVDLVNRACSCNMYQEYGYPCIHAYALICGKQPFDNTLVDYVSQHYRMSTIEKTCAIRMPNPPEVSVEALCQFSMDFDEEKCDCIKNTSIRYTYGVSDVESIRARVNAYLQQEKKPAEKKRGGKKRSGKKGTGGTGKKTKTSTRLSADNWDTCDCNFVFTGKQTSPVTFRMQTRSRSAKKTEEANSFIQNPEDERVGSADIIVNPEDERVGSEDIIVNPEDEKVGSAGKDQGVENEDLGYGLDDLRSEIKAFESEENLSSEGEDSDFGIEYPTVEDEDLSSEGEDSTDEEENPGTEDGDVHFGIEYLPVEDQGLGSEEEDFHFGIDYPVEDKSLDEEEDFDEEESPCAEDNDLLERGKFATRHKNMTERRRRKNKLSKFCKPRPDFC